MCAWTLSVHCSTTHIHLYVYLVYIVAKFTFGNGPWPLVMPLKGGNLSTDNGGVAITIVVNTPVIHTRAKVCM